jgi:aerobic-type carbon monoxide dehydrogenase small subunit (CoxS/CutS family)
VPHNIAARAKQEVQLNINGEHHLFWVAPNELLINLLRERMDLTGTKYGCGLGECGACTILIDGQASLSCLVLAASAEGKEIITIEGVTGPVNGLDALQDTFIEETAYQCGYCTPGFILTAKSLLAENSHPREEEVRDYFKGNRCRCTGYTSIVRAVMKHTERS